MEQTVRCKIKLLLAVCMILTLTAFTGCSRGTTAYEGGHIAMSYDSHKWELSYQEAEPYPVFDLYSEEAEIIIMLVENDGSILDSFHRDMVSLMSMDGEVTEKGKTDKWDKKGIVYYEDTAFGGEAPCNMILYGKAQEDKLIVGYAEIGLEKASPKVKDEILEIFSTLTFSEQEEIGKPEQNKEHETILIIYEMLNSLLKYETGGDEEADTVEINKTEGNETADSNETEVKTFSEEEIADLTYIEVISIEDYYGDKLMYDIYGPKESENKEGFVSYFGHGIFYSAMVYNMDADSFLYLSFDEIIKYTKEDWEREGSGYSEIEIGDIIKNGKDRYVIAKAMREDYYGIPYEKREVFYLDVVDEGIGVIWELELSENDIDEETNLLLDELAGCYGINLAQLKRAGDYEENNRKRLMEEQNQYEPREGDMELKKVEGYQYMGMTTLSEEVSGKQAQCPVMVPIGRYSSARENYAGANMHGVQVRANIDMLLQQNLMGSTKVTTDSRYKSYVEDEERSREVWKSEMIPLYAYEEAYYVIINYEKKDYVTEEFVSKSDVLCNIRIDDDFALRFEITFTYSEYDDYTDAIIKELETAYEIDLSEYYYENNK